MSRIANKGLVVPLTPPPNNALFTNSDVYGDLLHFSLLQIFHPLFPLSFSFYHCPFSKSSADLYLFLSSCPLVTSILHLASYFHLLVSIYLFSPSCHLAFIQLATYVYISLYLLSIQLSSGYICLPSPPPTPTFSSSFSSPPLFTSVFKFLTLFFPSPSLMSILHSASHLLFIYIQLSSGYICLSYITLHL